jgi:hypothetical protein
VGSIPDEVTVFFNPPTPSSRIIVLGWTQPLTEMSTRNVPGGKRRPASPSVSRLSRNCGSLNVSQSYGTPLPVTGRALSFYLTTENI